MKWIAFFVAFLGLVVSPVQAAEWIRVADENPKRVTYTFETPDGVCQLSYFVDLMVEVVTKDGDVHRGYYTVTGARASNLPEPIGEPLQAARRLGCIAAGPNVGSKDTRCALMRAASEGMGPFDYPGWQCRPEDK